MSSSNVVRFFGTRKSCSDCQMRRDCVWQALDSRLLEGVEAVPELFRRGERLFHAGERLRTLYVVRSGAVKTCLVSADGEEQIIGFHSPGDVLGLDGVADGAYACDAVALDTASVCAMSFDELMARATRVPALQQHILRTMSCTIKRAGEMVMMLGKKNAEQRMATFLSGCSNAQHARGYSATDISLPMSRADIGNYLSLAVETVCRLLTRMQASGVIEVQRSMVVIHDLAALHAMAGLDSDSQGSSRQARAAH